MKDKGLLILLTNVFDFRVSNMPIYSIQYKEKGNKISIFAKE